MFCFLFSGLGSVLLEFWRLALGFWGGEGSGVVGEGEGGGWLWEGFVWVGWGDWCLAVGVGEVGQFMGELSSSASKGGVRKR